MSRSLDPTLASALSSGVIIPALLVMITFKSATKYVWTGYGSLTYAGNTYVGVGSLGSVGPITETTQVKADGTTIRLSGIDPTLQAECMSDIQLGAPVKIWYAQFYQGTAMIGVPYLLFSGTVDKPTVSIAPEAISVSLQIENRLVDLQRATQRKYTSADQRIEYPNDIGFGWVEVLNDIALLWGG